jgi:hypothetical protein
MLQAGRSQVRDPIRGMDLFSIYIILPAAIGLVVHLAFNRNEYHQKQKNRVSGEKSAAGS